MFASALGLAKVYYCTVPQYKLDITRLRLRHKKVNDATTNRLGCSKEDSPSQRAKLTETFIHL